MLIRNSPNLKMLILDGRTHPVLLQGLLTSTGSARSKDDSQPLSATVEARKLECDYPHALTVKHKGS